MNQPTAPDSTDTTSCETFDQLAAARRGWIEGVLRRWCQQASLKDLRKAEQEWFDIAGRADANATLWTWAWERFPAIVHPDLPGVHETHQMEVCLHDGSRLSGFPDARQSLRGMLVLVGTDADGSMITHGAVSIDQIADVQQANISDMNVQGTGMV
ncbi:MAG: hypothetical protein WKF77_20330 [Planctomycetaceae bacterium]